MCIRDRGGAAPGPTEGAFVSGAASGPALVLQGHVAERGWLPVSYTHLKAVRFGLSGGLAERYDVWYRSCDSARGWTGWRCV